MNKFRQSQWNLVSIFTTIVSTITGVVLVNTAIAPVSAQPVGVYEQNVPENQPQSFIFGSPIPTPTPVNPYTGQAPIRDYSYPVNNFPPAVTYSYPANNFPPAVTYSYPVNVFPGTSYYSYPANGFPGTSYYSYPAPGTVVNSGPLNQTIINQPGHHTWFRGGRY